MAKGQRHQTRGPERLLGSLAHSGSAGHAASASTGDPTELSEDDVWSSQTFSVGRYEYGRVQPERGVPEPSPTHRLSPSVHDHRQFGGLSLAFDDGHNATRPTVVHQYRNVEPAASGPRGLSGGAVAASAPMNVPSWPSFLRVDSAEAANNAGILDGAAEGDDDEWLPPHEYLAREHRNSALATSVFEGAGRTLKGRDMSRVRDAVWSRTGFFG